LFEAGAASEGAPTSTQFLIIFWLQVVSAPLVLISAELSVIKSAERPRIAFVIVCAACIYPIWIALTSVFGSSWQSWVDGFKLWPLDIAMRLAIVFLPAISTGVLAALLFTRFRNVQVS
jgi:hypothetical protein